MCKRMISLVLSALLLLGMTFPVMAEREQTGTKLEITTVEEFLTFAENCRLDSYSKGLTVTLTQDLDLTGVEFAGVPIFSGSFDGQSHKLTGVTLTAEGSTLGLFRYLTETAQVSHLTVEGQLHPTGSRSQIGGIAGVNRGSITDCHFEGSISGGTYVGGIAGENTLTGVIRDCTVQGELHGDHFVGGMTGSNTGVLGGCQNMANINITPQQNSVEISDITMDSLLNTESANTVTDVGGIAGSSSGVIRECENRGDVGYPQIGYNIGGIAGSQSGYLTLCQNYGEIRGRKEVGGIVGQMEPALLVEYNSDTLQLLQADVDKVSALAGQAAGNAQANAQALEGQIDALQGQAETVRAAIDVLLSGTEDPDTLQAAQNTLAAAVGAMPGTLQGISAAAGSTANELSRDLNSLFSQVGKLQQTLNGAAEQLGGGLVDASDEDTEEELTGKVTGCTNYGAVLADRNAGGIAGAMAVENDLDILSDWQQSGEASLNFQGKVRSVITDCENRGTVTCKKQNGGGIVGWQSLGLVRGCTNAGALVGKDAGCVGGIAGESWGYLRQNYAKCRITAGTQVGGIAGSGTVVTDCISMVLIERGKEKLGAVLGTTGKTETQISGNRYLAVEDDPGAIDGISYAGQAEPVALEELLEMELPELFRKVTVQFLFEDGTTQQVTLTPGDPLPPEQIPELPAREGFSSHWKGLEQTDLEQVLFDGVFTETYAPYGMTIQSDAARDGLPLCLMEGSFTDIAEVIPEESDRVPALKRGQTHLQTWDIRSDEGGTRVRLLAPAGEEKLILLAMDGSSWRKLSFQRDGSYLVFAMEGTQMTVALVRRADNRYLYYIVAAALLLTVAAILTVAVKKHKKKNK